MEDLKTENIVNSVTSINMQELLPKLYEALLSFGGKLLLAIVVYFVGRWIVKRLNHIVQKIMKKREVDPSLFSFVKSLISISLNLVLIIIVISILGIETSSLIALFASAGLAIGMALSGTLQNFAGGVMILLFKPYKVGDYIEAQGQGGSVKEIQIFNTVLTTADNKTIIVPNGGLSTGIMTNYSTTGTRRVDWTFGIAYGDSYDKAKTIIEQLLKADKRVKIDPAHFIALTSLGNSSVNITVRAWVDSADYWDVFFMLNEQVYKVFASEGISIPFPQMDVHVHNSK
ncbi:MAG: mechanosensitive ion channel [Cytophagaceae bacterium]|jgi:small conductance mechanosensitive channel|nr:mechanosensitive ion channel [Cytophagaceae bacterium]